eukprot:gene7412-524_t
MSSKKPSVMMRSSRAATVSSANPLRHKSSQISKDTRERFNALDLEILLNEFRAVAALQHDDEPEESSSDHQDPQTQTMWLAQTGFESLAKQYQSGKHITDADIENEMAGFSDEQKRAVRTKAQFLNETLSKRGIRKVSKPSIVGLFPPEEAMKQQEDEEMRQRLLSTQATDAPTMFYDLSQEDQKQEFRPLDPKMKRRKAKPESPFFGTPLEEVVQRDRRLNPASMESSEIPIFFTRTISFLEKHGLQEEGIFRKAGSSARVRELRQRCEDAYGDVDFDADEVRAHDVAALFKQFLRETPEPLLTNSYIEAFSMTQHLKDQIYGIKLLVMLLPKVHRACLRRLLKFLVNVAQHSSINKMGLANLAVVFAPTLFYVHGTKGRQMLKEVEMQVTTASTLKLMLEHHAELWEVPNDILAQIRFVNESRMSGRKATKPKDLKRLLTEHKAGAFKTSKAPELMLQWVYDSPKKPPVEALVSVIGPTGEVLPPIEVNERTACRDILKTTNTPPIYHLYECGGNINRRRINPRSLILPVLRINPGLTLMIMGSS